ncbi:MAG: TonB-dependent receptor, partial [Gammaproteobacteria bacterium]
LNAIDIFDPVYGILPPLSPFTSTLEKDQAWGVYAHDHIDLTEQWKLHVGVRYDDFRQSLQDRISNTLSHQSVTATSPDVGLVYEPIKAVSFYASYGKGFRPNTGQDAHRVAFAPETTKSYEIGTKFETPEKSLTGTIALFKTDKTNVLTADPVNAGFSLAVGAAESKGVEVDVTARLPLDLRVMLSYAYVDAYISKSLLDPDFARPLAAGTALINVPAHSGNLMLFRDFTFGERILSLGAGANYVDKRLGETGTTFYLPAYTLAKLFASYEMTEKLLRTALGQSRRSPHVRRQGSIQLLKRGVAARADFGTARAPWAFAKSSPVGWDESGRRASSPAPGASLALRSEQLGERVVQLLDRRLDDDVAEVLRDADVALENVFDHGLVVRYAPRQELQQVVIAAADQMAFDHFVDRTDARLELDEVLAMMVVQRDLREDRDGLAQLGQIDPGVVAHDVAGFLEPLHAQQTRARRQGDGLGQVDIGNAAVALQLGQYVEIDPIELECGHQDMILTWESGLNREWRECGFRPAILPDALSPCPRDSGSETRSGWSRPAPL